MYSRKFQTSKLSIIQERIKKVVSRGQILMNMIKLDIVEWSLYESKPMSYDDFIKSYGKLNTQQTFTQTNEDNLNVDTQTDKYEFENKWTQFPVKCNNKLETFEDMRIFKMEFLGTGGDKLNCIKLINTFYDILKLIEFLKKAEKLILTLLQEKEFEKNIFQNEANELPFSEGFIELSVNSLFFLHDRQITMLYYSEINNKVLMSIHTEKNMSVDASNKQDYIVNCCIGCVWFINEPLRPVKLFYSQSPITTCCFHCTNNYIVLAGLQDGSICLWDLREDEIYHQTIMDETNELNWIVRSPTYTTAGNWEIEAFTSPIVTIRILSKTKENEIKNFNNKFISIEVCSLDETGHLIIWSVLCNLNLNFNYDDLIQWKIIKLIKSKKVPLIVKQNNWNNIKNEFVDMNIDNVDSKNLYIAPNDTNILYTNYMGTINNISYFEINKMDSCGNTTCIEVCPFKYYYFFAGCKDGSIRLHFLNIETPILKLRDENYTFGIKCIQWSKSKTLIIYVLDNYSRIIIWDLSNSDIHPSHKISTNTLGYVKCMKLSSCYTNKNMLNQYLAVGTSTGNIEIHKLKRNFCSSQKDDFLQEIKIFLNYVSII